MNSLIDVESRLNLRRTEDDRFWAIHDPTSWYRQGADREYWLATDDHQQYLFKKLR